MKYLLLSMFFLLGTILVALNAIVTDLVWESTLSILMSICMFVPFFKYYRKWIDSWTRNTREFDDV